MSKPRLPESDNDLLAALVQRYDVKTTPMKDGTVKVAFRISPAEEGVESVPRLLEVPTPTDFTHDFDADPFGLAETNGEYGQSRQ